MADYLHSKTVCKSILAELPSGARALLAEIAIDCPLCGTYTVQIAGHHLRAVRDFCIATIDRYPELTGEEPTKGETESYTLVGGGGDPSQN